MLHCINSSWAVYDKEKTDSSRGLDKKRGRGGKFQKDSKGKL